jgi:hypothetical protein
MRVKKFTISEAEFLNKLLYIVILNAEEKMATYLPSSDLVDDHCYLSAAYHDFLVVEHLRDTAVSIKEKFKTYRFVKNKKE